MKVGRTAQLLCLVAALLLAVTLTEAKKKRAAEALLDANSLLKKTNRMQSPRRKSADRLVRSPEIKAELAADNAGFEGVGQGALQVAV